MREALLFATIAGAVAFDFTNGFHDTANAIATSISTRALRPGQAVALAAIFNLVGALVTVIVLHSKVANTIAGTLSFKVGMVVVIAALLWARTWHLVTGHSGRPSRAPPAWAPALSPGAFTRPARCAWASLFSP